MVTSSCSLFAAESSVTQSPIIRIPYNRGVLITAADQIVRIEALSNYSKIYFTNQPPMTVAKVLQWFEPLLPPGMFSRVHRSHLVNKLFIQQIILARQNTLMLSNGERINISRRKKALLMAG